MLRRRLPFAFALLAIAGCMMARQEPTVSTVEEPAGALPKVEAAASATTDHAYKNDEKLAEHAPVDSPAAPMTTSTPTAKPPPPPRAAPKEARAEGRFAGSRSAGDKARRAAMPAPMGRGPAFNGLVGAPLQQEVAFDTLSHDGEFVSAGVNPLVDASKDRLSTFAIDVDTGSYTLGRRFLESGSLPPHAGVRVEEWVNAFHYSYPDESGTHPFSIHMEGAPLAKQSMLLRIGVQGKRIAKAARDPVHLVFLVDVSGSMSPSDRLPLAKQSLELLVNELDKRDSISLVTYAGDTRVVLPSTPVTTSNRQKILQAIHGLRNGGGTNMGDGMRLAYQEATKALGDKGISRVIVLSDGDANIGRTQHGDILKDIRGYVSEGVTMSTVGFGTGNLRDHLMERLADAGNGNYSYIGSIKDAKKVFVDDLTGTLQVIAKDTKIQVEMNPDVVAHYRLIGYENRDIADRDFRNDKVDAGEIGAGHTVTALYEVILRNDDPVGDLATVRVRYKQPRGEKATEVAEAFPASAVKRTVEEMSADGRFASGVALTAEVMRHSEHMSRLGIGLADAHRLLVSGATGPHAAERKELARLIAPLANGEPVAIR